MFTIAQYTPQEVNPVSIFGFEVTAVAVLTVLASALAAVALVKISVGIGKKVIAWFGGEPVDETPAWKQARTDGAWRARSTRKELEAAKDGTYDALMSRPRRMKGGGDIPF